MKKENSQKDAKNKMILNTILPRTTEIISANVWVMRKESIMSLTNKLDQFQEKNEKINEELSALKDHTDLIKESLPVMDQQIQILKEKIEKTDGLELTADMIMDEIFQP